ncbi:MAG: ATP-binding protein [Actinomycetota bacterium]|nr:ATP-binding protein [Acidimicrobiia bacterium]MDQ3294157.1 ATP-binding protein [Actinomycetota bacterium]
MTRAHAQRLEADPASVRTARRAISEVVDGAADGDQLDRLLLCASETVTNAIEHGEPPIDFHIAVIDRVVRVEVSDASPLRPRMGEPAPTSIRGRGLLIVDRCSDHWGVDEAAGGKTVWFEVDIGGS